MNISIELIKKLREKTGGGIADCQRALEEAKGDFKKAEELLKSWGIDKAAEKSDRETRAGIVDTYIHHNLTRGATVSLMCETDFVARTDEFKNLAHEIAMHVAAIDPGSLDELLESKWIKDEKKTIVELVKECVAKLGENITIKEFKRFEV